LGLSKHYKDQQSTVGKWLRNLFGLTFLNPEEVGDCLVEDLISEQPRDLKINQLLDYLVENYIDNEAAFPPTIWAACDESLSRTTNACESFHSKFNNESSNPHPNIYTFLNTFKDMQTDTYIKINALMKNESRCIRKEISQRQDFIRKKKSSIQTI
jgi:hypothetical protein